MIPKTSCGFVLRSGFALGALFLALCCNGSTGESSTDGETHFLSTCSLESGGCGSTLTCACGVCVAPCSSNAQCTGLHAAAQCITTGERPPGSCADTPAEAVCDVPCAEDSDCDAVGSGFTCSAGFCRVDSDIELDGSASVDGADTASSTTGAEGGAGSNGAPEACAEAEVLGGEVLVLGDVFLAQTHEITAELEALARDAGALGAAETYRDVSSATQNSLTMQGQLLLDQYTTAQAESPVKVVITNGGGTDLLVRSCEPAPTPDCPLMVDAAQGANQVLTQMATDGVEAVVWLFYPDPMDSELLAELDVLGPLLQQACADSPVPCHWVDLGPAFDGRYTEYMETDFVTTTEGARAAASLIWSTMRRECLAQ